VSVAGIPKKIVDSYVETEIDEEIVVLRLSDGDIFSMVGTSREVWRCIDGERTAAAIAGELAQRHGATDDVVAADVDGFIAELCDAGLVELA
jgi:hypothetical protein